MEPTPYTQRIRPARLGIMIAFFAFDVGLFGAIVNFSGGHWGITGVLGAFMLLMAGLASWFWELRFEVSADGVLAAWGGPFKQQVALADITGAGIEPYPAGRVFGWGYRMSKGDRALSDLSCPQALVLKLASGKAVYITLRDPEAALAAVASAQAAAAPG
jgi:hypothetical protein